MFIDLIKYIYYRISIMLKKNGKKKNRNYTMYNCILQFLFNRRVSKYIYIFIILEFFSRTFKKKTTLICSITVTSILRVKPILAFDFQIATYNKNSISK